MSQEKVKTMLYMQIFLGGGGEGGKPAKCIMGNSKIANSPAAHASPARLSCP